MKTNLTLSALAVLCGAALPAGAAVHTFTANLDGPSESPPNSSPGTGFTQVDYDDVAHTMKLHIDFTGLLGQTTACHIHAATAVAGQGTASVATQLPSFIGFPTGVSSGVYDNVFDMTLASTYNASYINNNGGTTASAEAALIKSFFDGKAYLNIHSSMFGGGEIRGFLAPIPAPSSLALVGLAGLAAARRRRS